MVYQLTISNNHNNTINTLPSHCNYRLIAFESISSIMSKIDEVPIFPFERSYDINAPSQWINVEGSIQVGLSNQVRRQQVPIENGVSRGRVEGLLSNTSHRNCTAIKLSWSEAEWHDNLLLVTLGNVNDAIERVLDNNFFRDDDNRTNENCDHFIH